MATMTMADSSGSMTTMSMPSATSSSSMDMSGMSGDMGMQMVFFTATNTALWSAAFVPGSDGQYAGACVLLILLSVIFRALLALRSNLLPIYDRAIAERQTRLLTTEKSMQGCSDCLRPWRINQAALQASFDTILAGISYLLYVTCVIDM